MKRLFTTLGIITSAVVLMSCTTTTSTYTPTGYTNHYVSVRSDRLYDPEGLHGNYYVGFTNNNWYGGTPDYFSPSIYTSGW